MTSTPSPSLYLSWAILRPYPACCNRIWVRPPTRPLFIAPRCWRSGHLLMDLGLGQLQISEFAIFGQCVGAIAWVPTAISILLVVLCYGLGPIWQRRPVWLRNFAAEEPGEAAEAVSAEITSGLGPGRRRWPVSTAILLITTAVGLVLGILASLNSGMGPLFLLPLVPEVSNDPVGHSSNPPPSPPRAALDQLLTLWRPSHSSSWPLRGHVRLQGRHWSS